MNYYKDILTDEGETKEKKLAVCSRGMMFTDPAYIPRLVEWIELLSILGADKIFLYTYGIPREMLRVLQHYEKKGVVDLTEFSMSGHNPGRYTIGYAIASHSYIY